MTNLVCNDESALHEHLVRTPEEWKNEIETSAVTLMATYGWSDPALRDEMERAIENAITKLDKKYTNMKKSEEERKKEKARKELLKRERDGKRQQDLAMNF